MTQEREIDVRHLAPPEPLQQVLSALETLDGGSFLHVIHRRNPNCLFSLLSELGYGYLCRPGDSRFDIWIWSSADRVAELAAREAGA